MLATGQCFLLLQSQRNCHKRVKTLWSKTFCSFSFWYQTCPLKLKMVESHMDPFPAPLKFLIKQWLFMDLQYKANSSSATTAQMEEDVTPARIKCQKFHIKPVTVPPLVLTEVKLFRFPGSRRWRRGTTSPAASLVPWGPLDFPFCCALCAPGTGRSWPCLTYRYYYKQIMENNFPIRSMWNTLYPKVLIIQGEKMY